MRAMDTRYSIRTKIIAWSFVPTMLILMIVAVTIYYAYQQVTENLVVERNRELVRLTASQLAAEMSSHVSILEAEARMLALRDLSPEEQRAFLNERRNRLVVFDGGVILLDSTGTVVGTEPDRPEIIGQDWSGRAYFRQVLHSTDVVFSDIEPDGPDGTQVIAFVVPVIGPMGEFQGAMAGMFRMGATAVSAFYGDLVKLRMGQNGNAYLVDGNGRLIYHSDDRRIMEDVSTSAVVRQALRGRVGTARTRDFDGQDILASFAPVPGTSWGLITQEHWATLTRSGQGYGPYLLGLLAMGVILPVLVVSFGVRHITTPIARLISAAQRVAEGDFDQTITTGTKDEIAELASQFNLMAARLRESYGQLEQRVADRTRELAGLNDIATVVSQSLDLNQILSDALDKTLEVLDMDAGGVLLPDSETGILRTVAYRGLSPKLVTQLDEMVSQPEFIRRLADEAGPLVIADLSLQDEHSAMRAGGFRSLARIPLRAQDEIRGLLFVCAHESREFESSKVRLLTSIGDQIGVAVDNARLFEAEIRRRQEQGVLVGMSQLVSSTLDLNQVLSRAAEYATDIFGVGHCLICLYDKAGVDLRCAVAKGFDTAVCAALEQGEMPLDGMILWDHVMDTRRPHIIEDVPQDPRVNPILTGQLDMQSILVVPIEAGGRPLGLIQLGTRRPLKRHFTPDEGELALAMANQVAMAIDSARHYEEQRRRAEQFRIINEVSRGITSLLDLDELLHTVVRLIKDTFGYYNVNILMMDTEREELVLQAGLEGFIDDSTSPTEYRLKVGQVQEGILGYVAATGEALLANDVSREPRYKPLPELPDTRAEIGVPIQVRGRVVGVLDVQNAEVNSFDEGDLITLQTLADQIGVAVENARLFAQAEQSAAAAERQRLARDLHDAVTQTLFSASLIAEVLPRIWERDPEQGRQRLEELRQLTRGALAEMRTLLLELRPTALAEASLPELLKQLAEATTGRSRVPIALEIDGACELPQEVKVAMYRIAQEALNNVAKHSGADSAVLSLSCQNGKATLCIVDQGRGFDPETMPGNRLGLSIMQERAQGIDAELSIESQIGRGTRVMVTWQGDANRSGT
jgi:nitrate/nitrite-specific signal transduction histidine kinase